MDNLEQILLDNDLEGTPYFVDDDYESAILGYTEGGNLVYSYDGMIEYLATKDDIAPEDAQE